MAITTWFAAEDADLIFKFGQIASAEYRAMGFRTASSNG